MTWARKYERISRHAGECSVCGDPIKAKTRIAFAPGHPADHWDCYADLVSSGGGTLPKPAPVISSSVVVDRPMTEVYDLVTHRVSLAPIDPPKRSRPNPGRRKAAHNYQDRERQRTASLRNAGPVRTSHVMDSAALSEKLSRSD